MQTQQMEIFPFLVTWLGLLTEMQMQGKHKQVKCNLSVILDKIIKCASKANIFKEKYETELEFDFDFICRHLLYFLEF